jgi:hypothetical protein
MSDSTFQCLTIPETKICCARDEIGARCRVDGQRGGTGELQHQRIGQRVRSKCIQAQVSAHETGATQYSALNFASIAVTGARLRWIGSPSICCVVPPCIVTTTTSSARTPRACQERAASMNACVPRQLAHGL